MRLPQLLRCLGRSGSGRRSRKKNPATRPSVVMVPDLPRENPEPPPSSGGWNDQGSAGPVTDKNLQPAGPIAMSAVGGISAPLTSPAGSSLPTSPAASSGGINSPPASSPSGGGAPAHPDAAPHSGFVLLAGGQGNGQFALASAELFDPSKNAFAAASSMKDAREDHTATVLPGGKILIAGGVGASGRALSSAELYDPISGKFSAVDSKMDTARAEHTATLISGCNCAGDGKILIAGGSSGDGLARFHVCGARNCTILRTGKISPRPAR